MTIVGRLADATTDRTAHFFIRAGIRAADDAVKASARCDLKIHDSDVTTVLDVCAEDLNHQYLAHERAGRLAHAAGLAVQGHFTKSRNLSQPGRDSERSSLCGCWAQKVIKTIARTGQQC